MAAVQKVNDLHILLIASCTRDVLTFCHLLPCDLDVDAVTEGVWLLIDLTEGQLRTRRAVGADLRANKCTRLFVRQRARPSLPGYRRNIDGDRRNIDGD